MYCNYFFSEEWRKSQLCILLQNFAGENPVDFLNTRKNVVRSLNPASKAIPSMENFFERLCDIKRTASFMRNSLMNALKLTPAQWFIA